MNYAGSGIGFSFGSVTFRLVSHRMVFVWPGIYSGVSGRKEEAALVSKTAGRPLRIVRGVLLASLAAICLFLVAIGSWPAFGLLMILAPLFKALSDARLTFFAPWLRQVMIYYLMTVYRVGFLLGLQAAIIPLAFAVFPAGFLLLILNLITGLVGLSSDRPLTESLFLCAALDLDASLCVPAVIGLHLAQLALAWIAIKKGGRLFDRLISLHARVMEWFTAWLHPPE